MNLLNKNKPLLIITLSSLLLIMMMNGCKKFVEVDTPPNSLNIGNVYASDGTAISVITGIYASMSINEASIAGAGGQGLVFMNLYPALSSDELTLYSGVSSGSALYNYYKNSLNVNVIASSDFWASIYLRIFQINSAIEGLNQSTQLTPAVKNQLLGEAYFLRALLYFYLTNLYGDVPLLLTTDYGKNSVMARTSKDFVYDQIVSDLILAKTLLSPNYLGSNLITTTSLRVRPTKFTADALLSRIYLYREDWKSAEEQSTLVIDNLIYDTVPLNSVFLKESKETLWCLQPVTAGVQSNTGEGALFILPSSGPSDVYPVYLSQSVVDSFESGDLRKMNWVNSVTVNGSIYYYPFKYKVGIDPAGVATEYCVVMRLAEVLLTRAEARAKQGNLNDALSDLNKIRNRAGLSNFVSTSQEEIISKIFHERRIELFTEWGHRWLDLKRTGNVDAIMQNVVIQKGTTWDNRWSLYPIPQLDIDRDPNLKQNPGY
jgi:starch-binding outer membrane protein, SusD/RagB family